MASTHLVILAERTALRWVLTEQCMAFPAGRSKQAHAVNVGDEIMLYTTRGCFRNPTRDMGRVIGLATVNSPVKELDEPAHFGERQFPVGFGLSIHGLTPFREGLVLRDLVPSMAAFPRPDTWFVRMRRPALTLPAEDADLLRRELRPLLRPYATTVASYRAGIKDPQPGDCGTANGQGHAT